MEASAWIIYEDLMKDAPKDEIEEIAYLMDTNPENLESMFQQTNIRLIFESLLKSRQFYLLTKHFNYDSSQNNHNSYRYKYIKPLRLLLYDLWGNITSSDNIIELFADIGVTMVNPQNVLMSFSEVEHCLADDRMRQFLEDLEKGLTERLFPSATVRDVKIFRENYRRVTEVDHLGRGSDMECGDTAPKSSQNKTQSKIKLEHYPVRRTKFYGFCLIINIMNFQNEDKYRKRWGSEKDADDLKKLFEDLDYEVVLKNDVTNQELVRYLNSLRAKDFSDLNVLVVFVMSHGEKDLFILSDGEKIEFQSTFQSFFMPENIRSLAGKPKLFFIQACQGRESYETFSMADVETSLVQHCLETDSGTNSLPTEVDFYFAVSTVPNYNSQRHTSEGGWFIQSLVAVVKEHAKKHELEHVMKMVNNLLTQKKGSKDQTQCSNVRKNTLRKMVYLGRPLEQPPV